ncbi:hypothetical protein AMECASPLE_015431 [Ameca splendens]|uniref:Uncharacterized protein n=1 Tax=Ameca splendens TaxID=208324 RepID=A0ABV0ZNS2_9TELE
MTEHVATTCKYKKRQTSLQSYRQNCMQTHCPNTHNKNLDVYEHTYYMHTCTICMHNNNYEQMHTHIQCNAFMYAWAPTKSLPAQTHIRVNIFMWTFICTHFLPFK